MPHHSIDARRALLALAAFALAATACSVRAPRATGASATGAWIDLLPGNASAWRGYQQERLSDGWRFDAASGELRRVAGGGDIVTRETYADFELELEWKVQTGGNSGVFYRATEETKVIYENATEMQILDNAGHRDGANALTSTGSNYALYAPVRDLSRPVGEWNEVRIVARGAHVEHWLNGTKVVEYEMWSPEWFAKVQGSKFAQWPSYGRAASGHIGLQDHGDPVAFRRIRIREIAR